LEQAVKPLFRRGIFFFCLRPLKTNSHVREKCD